MEAEGRVTRSLRRRLNSVDIESSGRSTPVISELETLKETFISTPTRRAKQTYTNNEGTADTVEKTPINFSRRATIAEENSSPASSKTPLRKTRRNSLSSMENKKMDSTKKNLRKSFITDIVFEENEKSGKINDQNYTSPSPEKHLLVKIQKLKTKDEKNASTGGISPNKLTENKNKKEFIKEFNSVNKTKLGEISPLSMVLREKKSVSPNQSYDKSSDRKHDSLNGKINEINDKDITVNSKLDSVQNDSFKKLNSSSKKLEGMSDSDTNNNTKSFAVQIETENPTDFIEDHKTLEVSSPNKKNRKSLNKESISLDESETILPSQGVTIKHNRFFISRNSAEKSRSNYNDETEKISLSECSIKNTSLNKLCFQEISEINMSDSIKDIVEDNESLSNFEDNETEIKSKSVTFNDSKSHSEKETNKFPKTPMASKSKIINDFEDSFTVEKSDKNNLSKVEILKNSANKIKKNQLSKNDCVSKNLTNESPNKFAVKNILFTSSTPQNTSDVILKKKSLLENEKKERNNKFSNSWSQSVRRSAGEKIDKLNFSIQEPKTFDHLLCMQKAKKQNGSKVQDYNFDDSEENSNENGSINEFIDDEAVEDNGTDSIDEEEHQYLKENEIIEKGISLGSEDTDQSDDESLEERNSFIVSDNDEENELLLDNMNEKSFSNHVQENKKMRNHKKMEINYSDSDNDKNEKKSRNSLNKSIDEKRNSLSTTKKFKRIECETSSEEDNSNNVTNKSLKKSKINQIQNTKKIIQENCKTDDDENENEEINMKINETANLSKTQKSVNENTKNLSYRKSVVSESVLNTSNSKEKVFDNDSFSGNMNENFSNHGKGNKKIKNHKKLEIDHSDTSDSNNESEKKRGNSLNKLKDNLLSKTKKLKKIKHETSSEKDSSDKNSKKSLKATEKEMLNISDGSKLYNSESKNKNIFDKSNTSVTNKSLNKSEINQIKNTKEINQETFKTDDEIENEEINMKINETENLSKTERSVKENIKNRSYRKSVVSESVLNTSSLKKNRKLTKLIAENEINNAEENVCFNLEVSKFIDQSSSEDEQKNRINVSKVKAHKSINVSEFEESPMRIFYDGSSSEGNCKETEVQTNENFSEKNKSFEKHTSLLTTKINFNNKDVHGNFAAQKVDVEEKKIKNDEHKEQEIKNKMYGQDQKQQIETSEEEKEEQKSDDEQGEETEEQEYYDNEEGEERDIEDEGGEEERDIEDEGGEEERDIEDEGGEEERDIEDEGGEEETDINDEEKDKQQGIEDKEEDTENEEEHEDEQNKRTKGKESEAGDEDENSDVEKIAPNISKTNVSSISSSKKPVNRNEIDGCGEDYNTLISQDKNSIQINEIKQNVQVELPIFHNKIEHKSSTNVNYILKRCNEILIAANEAKLKEKLKKKNEIANKNKSNLDGSKQPDKIGVTVENGKFKKVKNKKAVSRAILHAETILAKNIIPSSIPDQKNKTEIKLLPLEVLDSLSNERKLKSNKALKKTENEPPHNFLNIKLEKRNSNETNKLKRTIPQIQNNLQKTASLVSTSSGIFLEEAATPKRRKMSKIELPTGIVYEESITPKSNKKNGFIESPVTPLGFKVRNILSAGHKEIPQLKPIKKVKRKLIAEPVNVLPKRVWTSSGEFVEEIYKPLGRYNKDIPTQFYAIPLKSTKPKSKQLGYGIVNKRVLEFKNKALLSTNTSRETSKELLQRKERQKCYNKF